MDPILTPAYKLLTSAVSAIAPSIIKKLKNEAKDMSDDVLNAFFSAFSTYIQSAYERHSYFSSIVFPNQQSLLKDYYIPLTLVINKNSKDDKVLIDKYPGKLINEKKDLLVVDTAGMGKSTVLKYMFLNAVELNVGIPIFIELRKLNKSKTIFEFILNQLNTLTKDVNKSLVNRLLEAGEFVFFLDGFDEIQDSERAAVTNDIMEFKRIANKNKFILSSRDQVSLNALSGFFRVTIKPLTIAEAHALISKYSENSDLGKSLIQNLDKKENKSIHEFLKNPLLVSLLFKAYEYKHSIPLKKHVFYRQVFESLFENHDLSKDGGELNRNKLCGLDIHSFEKVICALGFVSLEAKAIEYTKEALLRILDKVQKLTPTIKIKPYELIEDLVSRVPLFILDGTSYRWSHKSIQEYFAAQYLSYADMDQQKKVLLQMYSGGTAESYINFLTLFADIDSKKFRQIVISALLNELIVIFKSNNTIPLGINAQDCEVRQQLKILREIVLVKNNPAKVKVYNKELHLKRENQLTLHAFHDYYFDTANNAIKQKGISDNEMSASYQLDKLVVVVVFFEKRYAFLNLFCHAIKFNLLTTLPENGYFDNDWKIDNSVLTKRVLNTIPFTDEVIVLTNFENDASYKPEFFKLLNECIATRTPRLIFDVNSGQKLLQSIEKDALDELNLAFNF